MKKLLYLLFYLIPFVSFAQVSTGQEAEFDYGIRNLAPQTVDNPNYLGTLGSDGTMGQIGVNDFLNGRAAQADTGVLDFGGLTTNSATTINIGFVDGYVVNNESVPGLSSFTHVSYAGATGVTVTTVGTGVASYVMLSSAGVISFQNTFPTSAERKAKIWLGKVSHPAGAVTLVVNEPDYITSPLAFSRDWFQDLGPYVNNGVYPYANGANLNINVTGGTITGDGINFVNSKQDPNHIAVSAGIAQAFMIRTQTGLGGAATTLITPTVYDVAGTITAIPGSSNQATIQYIWCVPGQGYIVQLGQTLYSTFALAVQALGKETAFTVYPNLPGNAIPIAALVVTKGCTALNDTGVTAQFFRANKNGDFFGASAGVSTATLQSAYSNSVQPTITTNSTLGALTVKRGSAADTDNIIVGQNGAGTNTFSVDGNGKTALGFVQSKGSALTSGGQLGSELATTGTGTNWTGSSFTTGYTHTAGSTASLTTSLAAINGSYYLITTTVTGYTAGLFSVSFGGTVIPDQSTSTSLVIKASSTAVLSLIPTSNLSATIAISVKLVSAGQSQFILTTSSSEVFNEYRGNQLSNIFNGLDSGSRLVTGTDNASIGAGSLMSIVSGSSNTALGSVSLYRLLKGGDNTAAGASALTELKYGSNNSVMGSGAASSLVSGSNNVVNGTYSLLSVSDGSGNTSTGGNSGRFLNDKSTPLTLSNNSVFLGYRTSALADNSSNETVVGYDAKGIGSNSVVLGNDSVTKTALKGNVIIGQTGTITDTGKKLQVTGEIESTSITTTVNTITITTAVSITTATTGTNSLGQNNRHVIIDNGVNPINITCNGGVTTSYGKVGTGAITFVQGSGRTLVQLSGTAVLNGAVGSTATLWSNGTTDYLSITNY